MCRTKYALAVLKSLGVRVNFWSCSEGRKPPEKISSLIWVEWKSSDWFTGMFISHLSFPFSILSQHSRFLASKTDCHSAGYTPECRLLRWPWYTTNKVWVLSTMCIVLSQAEHKGLHEGGKAGKTSTLPDFFLNRTWWWQWQYARDVVATVVVLPTKNLPWRPWTWYILTSSIAS